MRRHILWNCLVDIKQFKAIYHQDCGLLTVTESLLLITIFHVILWHNFTVATNQTDIMNLCKNMHILMISKYKVPVGLALQTVQYHFGRKRTFKLDVGLQKISPP